MKIEKISTGYLNVERLTLDNGVKRERVNHPDVVAAIVYDVNKEKFIFVEQFRVGCNSTVVEIVAGKIDEGEDKRTALEREIVEELGYKVESVSILIEDYYPTIGYSTERITIFLCAVTEKISTGGGIENENINLVEMDYDEFMQYQFIDGKSILARALYQI